MVYKEVQDGGNQWALPLLACHVVNFYSDGSSQVDASGDVVASDDKGKTESAYVWMGLFPVQ